MLFQRRSFCGRRFRNFHGRHCCTTHFPTRKLRGWCIDNQAYNAAIANNLVCMRDVEIDHETHGVRAELRNAHVLDRTTRDAVVSARAQPNLRARQIDDHTMRSFQREVIEGGRSINCDHYFRSVRARDY